MLNAHFPTVEVGAEVLKGMCVEPPYTPAANRDGALWGAPCPVASSRSIATPHLSIMQPRGTNPPHRRGVSWSWS